MHLSVKFILNMIYYEISWLVMYIILNEVHKCI